MAKQAGYLDLSRRHDLTNEELRSCALFAQMSDEEIKEVAKTIKRFTQIIFESFKKKQQNLLNKQ